MGFWKDGMARETKWEEISAIEARSQEYRTGSKKHMELCLHLAQSLSFSPGISNTLFFSLAELSRCTMAVRSVSGKWTELCPG